MDSVFFTFLSSIEPWMWFAAAVVLLPIAASIGEVTILPWISLALVFVGITDIFVFSVEIQLVTFCLVFFSSIVLSHRFLSSDTNQPLIAEGVGDMVGRELKITSIDPTNLFSGTAVSETGKVWNVQHLNQQSLENHKTYRCSGSSGINLFIEGI
jgi:membrane protein implicated in regulation of membrane protease activity